MPVIGIDFLFFYGFLYNFGTVPPTWYFLFFSSEFVRDPENYINFMTVTVARYDIYFEYCMSNNITH